MTTITEKLKQGIAAAEAGDRVEARRLLEAVVKTDETQLEAWRWLSQIVDSLEEKVICLENILILEPDNSQAQAELAQVRVQRSSLFRPAYAPGEEEPPPSVVTLPLAASQPITTDYPHKDEFDNVWLCPYCVAPTRPKDSSCPTCKKPLVVSARVSGERSVWLWRGVFFQLAIILLLLAAGSASYVLMLKVHRVPAVLAYLPAYLGLPVDQPEQQVQQVLALFPRWVFWSFIVASLYSMLLIGVLYFRVKHGNTIYLISGGFLLAAGVTAILFFYSSYLMLIIGALSFFLGIGQLFITMNLWNDFKFEFGRRLLKLDRDAKGHASFYLSGRKYAQRGMWGLAMLHHRQAVGRKPRQTVYRLALAVAYYHLQRYNLAQESLKRAEALDPDAPEIWELRQKLNAKTAQQPSSERAPASSNKQV